MGCNDVASVAKLEKHLALLKEEYTKLQRSHAELERKYNEVVASSDIEATGEFSSFVSRLALTASSLYGRSTYSDLNIKTNTNGTLMPAHKFVLHARSEKWRDEVLASAKELDWSDLDEDIATALLRWIYTDVVDLQHDRLTLGLLRVAHRFSLPALLGLCERALVSSVGVRSCVRFYCVAEEVGASALLEFCSGIISTHWEDLTPQDFEHMSGPLLYKMLKNKTKYPLHAAVRLLREDVVFLCLVENDTVLPELVNSLSENGQLPLQMALSAKNIPIAQTLVKNGSANLNAYDANGLTLLMDAVKRADHFAADFLLSQNCLVDPLSRPSSDSALHIVCSYGTNSDRNELSQMIDIGTKILHRKPNVNIQNLLGQTPLHIAITFRNTEMVNLLLDVPDININLHTNDEKSPLELSLTLFNEESFSIASKLLKMGANPDPLKSKTNDSLLQVLILNGSEFENAAIFLADFANLDHLNDSGMTAIHLAAKQNMPLLAAKLLTAGASPSVQTSTGGMKSPLHIAVEVNALQVLEAICNFRKDDSEPIDFNCKDDFGESPLSLCLALHRMELAPILIAGGADVNARNGHDLTLLHQCILNGDNEKAIFLLDQGAEINALTGEQKSALQLAIDCHLPKVVDALCIKGVDLGTLDKNGDPPLWTALDLGYEDVAQILIRHGVDTDCWSQGPEGCQQTLLHRAIDENKELIAMFLVQNQCDLDSPRQLGPNGEGSDEARDKASPLHLCCQWGLTKVVQALIDHGANVNALDVDNKSPAHIAIENQHEDIINILLCHPSIDLKVRDKSGLTPFATALAIRNHKAAQRILERLPNAAEIMDQRGRNFLHIAIIKDDLESVLFLLAILVDVNSRVHDAYQSTPLHLAAASKNEMIIRNLILAGARINERDAVQKMPLHIAIERGNISAVSAMIQNNADFDATDADGNNALHLAVHGGQLAIVRELLTESRVNAEATNAKGRNPLHELCRVGEDNNGAAICELFLECMPKYPINVPDMDGNTPLLLSYMRGQAPLCKVLVKAGACLGAQNREGISIFNYKLATDQLLSKLLDQLPKESPWSESELCQDCGSKFSLTMRKHHCRHCGRVLCSKCSNNDVPILKFGINKPVRVCNICFDVLHGGS
ncbi:rabankyrin-5 [Drosophila innubila]|uniref:rabankyrin-5 n=1 Tax=Drosophila innubila TaxID=198719 RepID=UPI00148B5CE1|nr:rabankyrin-5 [Drosophila innubila]XP_034475642.1 rabankyrin-5 [Drosophila innubila]